MRPKILVLTSTWPGSDEDVSTPRFVAKLVEHMNQRFRFIVSTQQLPGSKVTEAFTSGHTIRFRYAPDSLQVLSRHGGITSTLKKCKACWLLVPGFLISQVISTARLLKRENPDIVHAHWLIPQGLVARITMILMRRSTPLVVTSHGGDLYGLKGKLFRQLKSWVARGSDAYCVVSNPMRTYASENLGIYGDSIKVCPMGVDLTNQFTPGPSDNRKPNEIIFVGRLVEKKGVSHLLHAISILCMDGRNIRLRIIGTGPMESQLRALVTELHLKEVVEFVGAVANDRLPALYRSAVMAVFPFIQAGDGDMEGLGLVTVEAMGTKCPVVVGDVPAVHDLVRDKETGFIVDPTNHRNLADIIWSGMEDTQLARKIADNAYSHVHKNYTWGICAERYMNIYRSLLPGKSAP